jgi:multisubunit Na+/H+ antiporter MnhG subunit
VISAVLIVLALAVVMVASAGVVTARSAVTRLHFLAPCSTLALPLLGIAAIIHQGLTLGSAAIAVSVAAAALSAPVLTTSIARLVTAEDGAGRQDVGRQPR